MKKVNNPSDRKQRSGIKRYNQVHLIGQINIL